MIELSIAGVISNIITQQACAYKNFVLHNYMNSNLRPPPTICILWWLLEVEPIDVICISGSEFNSNTISEGGLKDNKPTTRVFCVQKRKTLARRGV